MSAKKIIIVGGGNAGLSVASQLLHQDKSLKISIIDPAAKHYYQLPGTLVVPGILVIKKQFGTKRI